MPNVNDHRYVASGPGHVGFTGSSGSSSSGPSSAIGFSAPSGNTSSNVSVGVGPGSSAKTSVVDRDLEYAARSAGSVINFDFDELGQIISDAFNKFSSSAKSIADRNNALALQNAREATAASQQMAREQMAYQTASDQRAMAFSAQQAQMNRDWQESLSNSAHQREVQDLIAAGLNPILSANAGAYTGSGATAQGFSSSGAMGESFEGAIDTSASGLVGQLVSGLVNTASQAAITGMYTDASKYQADMQYASAKLAAEASIFNNQNSTSAQKAIAQLNSSTDIQKANIAASSTLGAAGTYAAAQEYAAQLSHDASLNAAQKNYDAAIRNQANQRQITSMNNASALEVAKEAHWNSQMGSLWNFANYTGNLIDEITKGTDWKSMSNALLMSGSAP